MERIKRVRILISPAQHNKHLTIYSICSAFVCRQSFNVDLVDRFAQSSFRRVVPLPVVVEHRLHFSAPPPPSSIEDDFFVAEGRACIATCTDLIKDNRH